MTAYPWVDGNQLHLTITAPSGLVYQQTFPMAVLSAKLAEEGEIVRFTYDLVDPEDGTITRGAGRILVQEIPDPRESSQEQRCHCGAPHTAGQHPETGRQPHGAGASVTDASCKKCGRAFVDDGKFVDSAARYADFPFCRTCVDRCHDSEIADHWCQVDQYRKERG